MTLGGLYNQSAECVTLPDGLQTLTFGYELKLTCAFNQSWKV